MKWLSCTLMVMVFASSQVKAAELSLLEYVELVLSNSLEAQAIADRLALADLDMHNVNYDYDYQWVPTIDLGVTGDLKTQSVGLEVRKKNEFGTEFTLGSRYSRTESDNITTSESPSAYLRVEQGLFREWGFEAGRYNLSKAEISQKKVFWSTVLERQNLIRRAVQTYFSVALAEQRIKLRQANLISAQKNLEISESRHSLGLVPKTDIYRAKLALLNAQDSKNSEDKSYRQQTRQLLDLINVALSAELKPEAEINRFVAPKPPGTFNAIYAKRSDWQSYLLDAKGSKLDLKDAKRKLYPDVRLSISGEKMFDDDLIVDTGMEDDVDWRIGLNYSTPLNLVREKNQVTRRQIQLNNIERNRTALKRHIEQQVLDAFDEVSSANRRLEIARERIEQSEKAAELAEIRYQRGLSSNLDLIEAENELQAANSEVLQQTINLNMAIVTYALRTGALDYKWLEQNVISIN